jgi:hypothetical protein
MTPGGRATPNQGFKLWVIRITRRDAQKTAQIKSGFLRIQGRRMTAATRESPKRVRPAHKVSPVNDDQRLIQRKRVRFNPAKWMTAIVKEKNISGSHTY